MMKRFFVALSALTIAASAACQTTERNLLVAVGGGQHQLFYKFNDGDKKGGLGYNINTRYSIFFNSQWGASAGLGVSSYKSSVTLNVKSATPSVDSEGDSYELRTSYNQWEEKHSVVTFDIPLGITYRSTLSPKIRMSYTFGGILQLPIKTYYKVNDGGIITSGYYSKWNVELFNIPEQGFRNYNERPSGNFSLRPSLGLFADFGTNYSLSEKLSLYVGAYGTYGLNNLLKTDSQTILNKNGEYQSMLKSDRASKINILSVGLKIGVTWSQFCVKK